MAASDKELVLIDLAIAVGQGLGNVQITRDAVKDWADHYEATVAAALQNPMNKWEEGPNRNSARKVGKILGQTASALAIPDSGGGLPKVNLDMAQRAKVAIKNHPACAGNGTGEWCKET